MMLSGRRLVVTGAGGIGEQVARRAMADGASVHLADRDRDRVSALAADLGCGFSAVDLSKYDEVGRAMSEAEAAMGGVDALVAVAGGSGRRVGDGPVHTLTDTALEETMAMNVTPAALALGAFLRHRDAAVPGSVVLVGSVLARHPHRLFPTHAYAASKAAIEGLAVVAANYYADQGVCINVVAPGLTRTPMSARAQGDDATLEFIGGQQPLATGGFVEPNDVASISCALLANPVVTGQVIAVDGGWSVI